MPLAGRLAENGENGSTVGDMKETTHETDQASHTEADVWETWMCRLIGNPLRLCPGSHRRVLGRCRQTTCNHVDYVVGKFDVEALRKYMTSSPNPQHARASVAAFVCQSLVGSQLNHHMLRDRAGYYRRKTAAYQTLLAEDPLFATDISKSVVRRYVRVRNVLDFVSRIVDSAFELGLECTLGLESSKPSCYHESSAYWQWYFKKERQYDERLQRRNARFDRRWDEWRQQHPQEGVHNPAQQAN